MRPRAFRGDFANCHLGGVKTETGSQIMGDAARQWNAAIEDPSKLIEENREWLRAARMLVSGDEAREKEGSRIMDALRLGNHGICCPIPFTEVMEKKCSELHAAYLEAKAAAKRLKSQAKKLRASVTGGLLSDQNRELREEIKHASNELANALIREQELWAENRKLKDELAEVPHWVPVAEFENDSKFHIVWDADEEEVFEATCQKRSGIWFAAYGTERRLNVTHVLVGLNPPVVNQGLDPRGDGDMPSTSERLDNLACERMCDRPALKYGTEEGDECNRNGCNGTIVLDRAENCYCHITAPCSQCTDENRLHCDKCLIRGIDLDPITPDTDVKLSAEQMADALHRMVDVTKMADEDAIRERLLHPFLGSEAETLGATTYQLRDGERWLYKCGDRLDDVVGGPYWFNDDTYRLATGE